MKKPNNALRSSHKRSEAWVAIIATISLLIALVPQLPNVRAVTSSNVVRAECTSQTTCSLRVNNTADPNDPSGFTFRPQGQREYNSSSDPLVLVFELNQDLTITDLGEKTAQTSGNSPDWIYGTTNNKFLLLLPGTGTPTLNASGRLDSPLTVSQGQKVVVFFDDAPPSDLIFEFSLPTYASGTRPSSIELTNVQSEYGTGTTTVSVTNATVSLTGIVDTTPPDTPPVITNIAVSPTQAALTWSAAGDPESDISFYKVWRDDGGGQGLALVSTNILGTTFQDNSVTPGTYTYIVEAENGAGLTVGSDPENAIIPTQQDTTPPLPFNITNIFSTDDPNTAGNVNVTVQWDLSSDPESGIAGYLVLDGQTIVSPAIGSTGALGPNSNEFEILNVLPLGTHTYIVRAVNAAALTTDTVEMDCNVRAGISECLTTTIPDKVTGLSATFGDSQVTLVWTPLTQAGITYQVYQSLTSFTNINQPGVTQFTGAILPTITVITGLTNGTPYFFRVRAMNNATPGALSDSVTTIPNATGGGLAPPTASPQNIIQTPSLNAILLTWDAVPGAADYNIYAGTVSGQLLRIATGIVGTTYNYTGLLSGTTYFYQIAAVNSAGEGPRSAEVSIATLSAAPNATVPPAPSFNTVTPGNEQATLTWVSNGNGGSTITGFNIEYSLDPLFANAIPIPQPPTANSVTVANLTNSLTYYFHIQAMNAIGVGPFSAPPVEITPTTAANPVIPIVTFTSGGRGGGQAIRGGGGSIGRRSGGTRILQLLRGKQPKAPEIIAITPQPVITPEASCFPDIGSHSQSEREAICGLQLAGTISGNPITLPNGQLSFEFRGNQFLNRAEGVKFVFNNDLDTLTNKITNREDKILQAFRKFYPLALQETKPTGKFRDVPRNQWFAKYVHDGFQKGSIDGVNNGAFFDPAGPLRRVELEKIALEYAANFILGEDRNNFIKVYLDNFSIPGDWWLKYAAFSAEFLFDTEVGSKLLPGQRPTRAQTAEFIWALMKLIEKRLADEGQLVINR